MIIELGVGAGLVAAAAFALRALRRKVEPLPDPPEASQEDSEVEGTPPRRPGPRGLQVGDVLLYADTELWLAGCIDLDEEGFVARAFPTPGNRRAEWVVQLDSEAEEIILAREAKDEVPGGRVPAELPIDGIRLGLRRRGSASVLTEGENLPRTSEKAEYVLLQGPGGRTLLVLDFDGGKRLALKGEHIGREMLDLLPGSD